MDVNQAVGATSGDNRRAVIDEPGRDVLSFASEIRNLSRTAGLVDMIVDMHASGTWRRYETAVGSEEWLECEFDYFLIVCEASYDDISRVLAWNREGRNLAAAMESADRSKRRPFEEAADSWKSTSGETLRDRALRQGWTNSRGRLRPPPVPERARAKLRHGMTLDERARRRREESIPASRRKELDRRVAALLSELPEVEVRYVRDSITAVLKRADQPE